MALVAGMESGNVHKIIEDPGIKIYDFQMAPAYANLIDYLEVVTLPKGSLDLNPVTPSRNINMQATSTVLLVNDDIHPAIQYLFLKASKDLNKRYKPFFNRPGGFPAYTDQSVPESSIAARFYEKGLFPLDHYLPFWLAGPVERLLIVLIPLFAVVFPVAHFLPTILANMTERKIFRFYGELKLLEAELAALRPDESVDEIVAALDKLAARAGRLRVGIRYQQRRFILKDHITEVQQAAERHRATLLVEPAPAGVP